MIHEKTNYPINYQTTRELNTPEMLNKGLKTLLKAISIEVKQVTDK